ncbi:MAG: hypothetical protein RBT81_00510 [Gammaproteobacteria bacterium]|jgi:hypothetical protein|nr:hypothetical protein [Gammaproteobacteria bacterium]
MTFETMVLFLIELAIACIPAVIILSFIGLILTALFGIVFGSLTAG